MKTPEQWQEELNGETSLESIREIQMDALNSPLLKYEAWFYELIRIAKLNGFSTYAISTFDKEAWKSYFDDGKSPAEALAEDCDAGIR